MPSLSCRHYTAEFKTEVAVAALMERQPLAELSAHYQLATARITRRKLQLRQQAAQVFAEAPVAVLMCDVEPIYAAIYTRILRTIIAAGPTKFMHN